MNLFWKKLFGGLKPTDKLEGQLAELQAQYNRYQQVSQSAELEEYKKLQETVNSASFKDNKKQLQSRKYKDTEEYRDWTTFQKLQNNAKFKSYLHTLQSPMLAEYLQFRKTAEYARISDKAALKEDPNLKKMADFEKSADYKNYIRFNGSAQATEYERLQALVATDDFKKRNAFWQNAKRWETTEEAKQDARYQQLAKNEDIVFYEKCKPETFAPFQQYEEQFVDNFDWNTLSASKWQFGFHYKSSQLKSNHSFVNEQQANNGGKNISVSGGTLHLATRQENVVASAWDPKKGFVEKQFGYTSDAMQTGDSFKQKGGVFMAKLRCSGNIHHAFWLGADGKLPHVNVFHFNGKHITVGNASANMMDEAVIKGINPAQFYIYSLAWNEREMIWYVNNVEVFRTSANIPQEQMYMAFSSFISQNQTAQPGMLEVDWVKAYKLK